MNVSSSLSLYRFQDTICSQSSIASTLSLPPQMCDIKKCKLEKTIPQDEPKPTKNSLSTNVTSAEPALTVNINHKKNCICHNKTGAKLFYPGPFIIQKSEIFSMLLDKLTIFTEKNYSHHTLETSKHKCVVNQTA